MERVVKEMVVIILIVYSCYMIKLFRLYILTGSTNIVVDHVC